MAVKRTRKCIKDLSTFFNSLLIIGGMVLVLRGIFVELFLEYNLVINNELRPLCVILVIHVLVGVLTSVYSFCCFHWIKKCNVIAMVAGLLTIFIIFEFLTLNIGCNMKNKVSAKVYDNFSDKFKIYNSTPEFRASVDRLQERLKCCGVRGPTDWKHFDPDGTSVPDSCCLNIAEDCGKGALMDLSKVHMQGCCQAIAAKLQKRIMMAIIAAPIVQFMQMFSLTLLFFLRRDLHAIPEQL